MPPDVSTLLLNIYRASRRMRHANLRAWMFERLESVIQFDSACWFRSATTGGASRIHAWYLHDQPASLLQEYASRDLWRDDIAHHRLLAAPPGSAIRASYTEYNSPRMCEFLRRHRLQHIMSIAVRQDVSQIAAGISLYRNETRPPFEQDDAALIEMIAPHFVDTWRENWLHEVARSACSTLAPVDFSLAVVMPDRMMSEAQDNLGSFMHREWADWRGPWLPEALLAHLSKAHVGPWVGQTIVIYDRMLADQSTLLIIRLRHELDRLPPRKREVAMLFARGATQTEVAHKLNLSTSTVNNYLGNVYEKLGLSDKTDLSRLVDRLQP